MILLNDFGRQWSEICEEATATFRQIGESGWYILGREVQQFEKELAEYWGLPRAIGVASGLDAIEICLRTLGCKAGDKVLTTPISAFATTLAILKIGAMPVFTDTDQFGLVDLDAARDTLQHDPTIRWFIPVHLYGHALDLGKLRALQEDFEIAIIEDCAQSVGARSAGLRTGCVGRMAATSFYPTKNLGAMGDGGAILTANAECADHAQVLRDYGQTAKYQHDVIGYNSRLDELQAALLRRVSLPRLDRWTARRRHIAASYIAGINNQAVRVPGPPPGSESCWHLFPVIVEPECKLGFMQYMKTRGVGTGEHYPIAIPDQRACGDVSIEITRAGIERARRFCRSQVSLPVHPYLSNEDVATVVEAVNDWKA